MILIINTHWDHKGAISRYQTSQLYLNFLPSLRMQNDKKLPIIICGDFNETNLSNGMKDLTKNGYQIPLNQFQFPDESIYGVHFFEPNRGRFTYTDWRNQFKVCYFISLFYFKMNQK